MSVHSHSHLFIGRDAVRVSHNLKPSKMLVAIAELKKRITKIRHPKEGHSNPHRTDPHFLPSAPSRRRPTLLPYNIGFCMALEGEYRHSVLREYSQIRRVLRWKLRMYGNAHLESKCVIEACLPMMYGICCILKGLSTSSVKDTVSDLINLCFKSSKGIYKCITSQTKWHWQVHCAPLGCGLVAKQAPLASRHGRIGRGRELKVILEILKQRKNTHKLAPRGILEPEHKFNWTCPEVRGW